MNNDICLVAIVRDEAQYIERMLRSALPHCKDAVICDTGSKDDTVRIARNMLVEFGVQGTLVTEGWANFSHNRNLALERARKSGCDWILILDGDEELVAPLPLKLGEFGLGCQVRHGESFHWYVPRLVRQRDIGGTEIAWSYVGACHEYITAPGVNVPVMPRLEGAFIRHLEDGKRSPEKLHRNLELLLKEEQANPNNARTKFYIANTFFDMGKYLEAMGYYLRRMEMPDWEQEAFYAQYRYAICQERLGNAVSIIAHWSAWDYRPSRIEPLVALARLYRARNEFNAAYMVTGIAVKTPMTTDSLFVDAQAWEWDAPLEHGIACLATGRNKEAVETLALLVGKPGPEHLRQGAVANLRVALSKLT